MRHSESLEDALHRWALNERQALKLGYPAVAAGFSEYRSGYRQNARVPDQFQIDTLGLVERGIGEMRKWPDTRPLTALTEHYGAYPDAPEKTVRLETLHKRISRRRAYEALDKARLYLQGIIDIYAADMV
jgi:hypothetical protein